MEKHYKLPKIETNSFYERYKPKSKGLYFNTNRDVREFETWKLRYTFDQDGNCRETIIKYEDN